VAVVVCETLLLLVEPVVQVTLLLSHLLKVLQAVQAVPLIVLLAVVVALRN
jgi:hypothetical protein